LDLPDGGLNADWLASSLGDRETCRKHGISEPTYYKWKSQFSGMTVSHLAQLRQLQDENAKLKRMYADLALMHHALKDVVDRKL
jgi:putative transposase